MTIIDYKNKKIDNLTILEKIGKDKNNYILWDCKCDCGEKVVRNSYYLSSKKISKKQCKKCASIQRVEKRLKKLPNCPVRKYNKYDLSGEYAIGFTDGKYSCCFLFDKEDYDKIKNYRWIRNKRGYIHTTSLEKGRKRVFLHSLILNSNVMVDHINRNPLDNRKCNLRFANISENTRNKSKKANTSSKYIGISKNKNGLYVSYLTCFGNRISSKFKDIRYAFVYRLILENKYFVDYSPQINLIKEFFIDEFCYYYKTNKLDKSLIELYIDFLYSKGFLIKENNEEVFLQEISDKAKGRQPKWTNREVPSFYKEWCDNEN